MHLKLCLCLSFLGEHGKFKNLSQPDDFNDALGKPLSDEVQTDDSNKSVDSTDLRDQFDEGNVIHIFILFSGCCRSLI